MKLSVNGEDYHVEPEGYEALVDTLNGRLGFRSVRPTCGVGLCGTCSVLMDGKVVSSCIMLTRQAAGGEIVTSEGLTRSGLTSVQEAFLEAGAYQCGYCIPGMIVTIAACLQETPAATKRELREYLAGNLCRCGSYGAINTALDLLTQANDAEES